MEKTNGKMALLALLAATALSLNGCASSAEQAPAPTDAPLMADGVDWPKDKLGASGDKLDVYVTDAGETRAMDVESYVEGVLAGEMKNDWPPEALKAQAILARTFVLKFVQEKESRYAGADISTDVEEAQAYDAAAVNDRVRDAVAQTAGLVLVSDGKLPYAWFHAHSGGMTALAREGLGWDEAEPGYTKVAEGNEPQTAIDARELQTAAEWEASFPAEEFAAACAAAGAAAQIGADTAIEVAERGESGRAVTLAVGDARVNAAALRIALGSTKMRSTLLTRLRMENGKVVMAGKGYGHGVGMSQWGAYGMAEGGATAEEIVGHYFQNAEVVKLW